jgi:hypothetical protein
MILWTIQTIEAWNTAQRSGQLICEPEFSERDYSRAYDWMGQQMEARIGPRQNPRHRPIRAWLQWGGPARPRPDLRSVGHLQTGRHGVRIEFTASDDEVLLSDFEWWHAVLNGWYVATSKADNARFDREAELHHKSGYARKSHVEIDNELMESWQRIFDLDRYEPGWDSRPEERAVQATLWQIPLESVRKVQEFIGR